MIIKYKASVYTPAGWRSVSIRAEAERVSPGFACISRVLEIDGEEPARGMSRTGARRQEFHGTGIAAREVGSRKRISACTEVLC